MLYLFSSGLETYVWKSTVINRESFKRLSSKDRQLERNLDCRKSKYQEQYTPAQWQSLLLLA